MSPRFDAHEAERIGLVHKAMPDAELSAHVAAAAANLASAAPITLALMKQNLNDGLRTTFGEQLDREAERHRAERADRRPPRSRARVPGETPTGVQRAVGQIGESNHQGRQRHQTTRVLVPVVWRSSAPWRFNLFALTAPGQSCSFPRTWHSGGVRWVFRGHSAPRPPSVVAAVRATRVHRANLLLINRISIKAAPRGSLAHTTVGAACKGMFELRTF